MFVGIRDMMQLSNSMCLVACFIGSFICIESHLSVSRLIDSVSIIVSSLFAHVSSDVLQIPRLLRHSAA